MRATRRAPRSRPWTIVAALGACLGVLGPVGGLLARSVLAEVDIPPTTGRSESVVSPEAHEDEESILLETRWCPVEIDGDTVALAEGEREPFFVLGRQGSRLHGFTGCNRLTGSFETDGSSLKAGPLGTTRILCPPGPAALESRFLAALETTASWAVDGRILELRDEAGRDVMRLEERNLD